MKKTTGILLALLALTAALLFTACGATDAGTPTPPAAADVPPSSPPAAPPADGTPAEDDTPAPPLSGVVKTGGSTSVETVMNALIFQFQADNTGVTVDYEMNGSGDGIKNTISGLYEIGHSSRELKSDGSEDGLDAIAYAIDGIAVVANLENTVSDLTKDQLLGIYTGAVSNWQDVGGPDAPITVVTREPGSGTRSAFAEIIGLEKDDTPIAADASVVDSTGAVQTTVSQNPNAIGYMSFSDVDDTKVNAVPYEGVAISTDTLKSGDYLLKREFYLLTRTGAALSPAAQAFTDFVLGADGQRIVADNKLLPIR
ncbi:MAG: phosphate ABC transporter substrate-binding protein [Oscillospiraceae bacterium]|jgi:phosphate transport system substrate-binding protein|nr:phosphate ABC transporter substrate-binding protein [Oscillospiraceae bacterium]